MRTEPERALLRAGRNCWRIEHADRVAWLIGRPAYFSALRQSLLAARQSVRVVGWHLNAATELVADDAAQDHREQSFPTAFGELLRTLVQRTHRLRCFVLDWDYSMLYAVDRDLRSTLCEPWQRHRRLHVALDGTRPVGAAQHEKLVVVDDAIAYAGGIDLSPPLHGDAADAVQIAVDGAAAAAVAERLQERWRRVAGRLPQRRPSPSRTDPQIDPWPDRLQVDLRAVEVAIARTAAAAEGRPAVTEVQQLLLDAIGAARGTLYIETPTLTVRAVGDALSDALQRHDGPEVLLVTSRDSAGWLEPVEQLARRAQVLAQLRTSDRHGRLRVLYPERQGSGDDASDTASQGAAALAVTGLLVVVDARLLVVGSATLGNRSLTLDTECCLAIEAHGDDAEAVAAAITKLRDARLATHLDAPRAEVADALARGITAAAIVDEPRTGGRALRPLQAAASGLAQDGFSGSADPSPERPVGVDALTEWFDSGGSGGGKVSGNSGRGSRRGRTILIAVVVVLVLGLTAAWRWTPLSEMVDVQKLAAMARQVADTPLAPLWVLGAFLAGSLVALPVTLLIVATSLVFSTGWALVYALAGALAAAALNFAIGRALGQGFVSRIGGQRWNRLNQRLSQSGVLAMFALRILPVAPFVVVNLAAGASQLRFRDFMLGSLLGMAPGVMTITVFSGLVTRLFSNPSPMSIAALVAGGVLLLGVGWGLQRWVGSRSSGRRH